MDDGESRIVPGANRRLVETRPSTRFKFTIKRRERFLSHLAATCNVRGSAAAAGICADTAYRARRNEPLFRAQWEEALDQGYARLEARLVELAEVALGGEKGIEADPRAAEMDVPRILALLRQRMLVKEGRNRGGGAAGRTPRAAPIEDVAKHLIKRLKAMGVTLPPASSSDGDLPRLAPPETDHES